CSPQVSDEPLRPVYLMTGNDRPKVVRALRRLRARFGDESVEQLTAESASGPDAVAACNALGLFAGGEGGRLVVVEGVERWRKADAEAMPGYLGTPGPVRLSRLSAAPSPPWRPKQRRLRPGPAESRSSEGTWRPLRRLPGRLELGRSPTPGGGGIYRLVWRPAKPSSSGAILSASLCGSPRTSALSEQSSCLPPR